MALRRDINPVLGEHQVDLRLGVDQVIERLVIGPQAVEFLVVRPAAGVYLLDWPARLEPVLEGQVDGVAIFAP